MAKSARERMAEYRKRKRENPDTYEQYKASERERYRKRRERGEIKLIHQLSDRGKRRCRRRWVEAKRSSREKQKMVQPVINTCMTPPTSPDRNNEQVYAPPQHNRAEAMRKSHKRRSNKEKSACYRQNEKLKVKLKNQEKLKEKYKRRYNRLKGKFTKKQTAENPEDTEKFSMKSYKLYQTLIMNIRKWYGRTKSRLDRQMIADVICSKRILKRYGLGAYCSTVLGISRRYMKLNSRVARPASVRKLNMKEKVRSFLERDDNSRLKADKQATITRKGVKMQVRLLSDDLKTLHKKFQLEGSKMSYSLFCELRPFWIRKATEKDRKTCLCKIHENLNFKINTCYKADMITTKDPRGLMKKIVCDTEEKKCMYRECDDCKSRSLIVEHVSGEQLTWNEWINKRIERGKDGKSKVVTMTVKQKTQGTKETLAEELNKELQRACRHYFNIRHQYLAMRLLKEKMSHEDVMLHVDFSENYNTKYESEIQSMHFGASRRQISLHTGVAYISNQVYPFCTVSDCLKHGPAAIWAHMEPVISYIKTTKPLSGIHFLTDGPTTQYRNKMNFYLWSKKVYDYGFTYSSWNFLEASHGKGAADGIGAAIKRAADHQVNVKGRDIACADDLVACVQPASSVKMFLINESSVNAMEMLLPSTLIPIPGTMKLHQLTTCRRDEISCRVLSCFCGHPSVCNCFQSFTVQFPNAVTAEPNTPDVSNDPATTRDSTRTVAPSSVVAQQTLPATTLHQNSPDTLVTALKKVTCVDETLIGQYAVVEYDGLPFPGIIVEVDEDDLEVKVMHKVGRNRYFWPMMDDQCWYTAEKVITLLDKEPEHVTARHCQIPPNIWELIVKELDI